ncbi:MAG: hypothetical protein L6M37_01910, partial [Candidatus Methylarchaceae archaeon HK02M1]|nr:hypothetical protein [Candidatus Methylarchaceae archaeon HK02M1]
MEKTPADITLHGNLVNVYTGIISPSYIGIIHGMVTYVGSDPIRSKEKIELGSKYILPGFINAHMHIESSMMIP